MKKPAPNRIYLQWDSDDVTWCIDQIEETDVEYVRADLGERNSEAMEKLGGEKTIQLTRTRAGIWIVGVMRKHAGRWEWIERNRNTDLVDAILGLQEKDDG